MLSRCIVLIILTGLGCSRGTMEGGGDVSAREPDANEIFVLQSLESAAESFFNKSLIKASDSLIIDVRSFAPLSGVEQITRSVFQKAALQSSLHVVDAGAQQLPGDGHPVLRIEILDWTLRADEKSKHEYEQAFRSFFLLQLLNNQGFVLHADTLGAARNRTLATRDDLEVVQASVPAFRHQLIRPIWSRKDFFESMLVTTAAAMTVFLLYRIRSQ